MVISTHVPRAGHDRNALRLRRPRRNFNSRAPCGARRNSPLCSIAYKLFQLTCPMRGTTKGETTMNKLNSFQLTCPMRGTTRLHDLPYRNSSISTHVPHAGHDRSEDFSRGDVRISTHVPHAGHDQRVLLDGDAPSDFNSRAPCGARPPARQGRQALDGFQLTCPMRGTTGMSLRKNDL